MLCQWLPLLPLLLYVWLDEGRQPGPLITWSAARLPQHNSLGQLPACHNTTSASPQVGGSTVAAAITEATGTSSARLS